MTCPIEANKGLKYPPKELLNIGDKFLAEWMHGYDMCEIEKEEIEITSINEIGFGFKSKEKRGIRSWFSTQCREVTLLEKR